MNYTDQSIKLLSEYNFQEKLEEIAKKHLNIETLKTQKCDSLDFYDLAVWNISSALTAAYAAGYYEAHMANVLEKSTTIN